MVFPQFSDFPQAEVLDIRSLPVSLQTPGAVLTNDAEEEDTLASPAARWGNLLLLQECWQSKFPDAGVLISSAISGGTLRQRLADAMHAAPGRCWLLLEPICMEFAMPCTGGIGHKLPAVPSGTCFYSNALCCYYTHSSKTDHGHFTLFDTQQSLLRKISMARELGFCGFAAPSASCCAL